MAIIAFAILFVFAALFIGTLGGMVLGAGYIAYRFINRRALRAQGITWWK